VSSQVQLIDLFPTILDFLNISQDSQVKANIQGKSIVPIIEGEESEEFAYGEMGKRGGLNFVRTSEWKLIREGENTFQLYNLRDDPKETKNVIAEYHDIADRLKKNLFEWMFTNLQKKAGL
ncbi:MAG: DUF4976 domain-containing protein, partial [bacterium]|nr:DUF4976 domain-containing protein [bacterium]